MNKTGINRRKLLASIPAMCILTICNSALMAGMQHDRELKTLAGMLVHQLENRRSACVVGREYLCSAIDEAHLGRLIQLILGDPEGQALADLGLDHYAYYAYLEHRYKSDFTNGRVVEVGGWILSVTEARVCALATTL